VTIFEKLFEQNKHKQMSRTLNRILIVESRKGIGVIINLSLLSLIATLSCPKMSVSVVAI
jgi:hypothetical protein